MGGVTPSPNSSPSPGLSPIPSPSLGLKPYLTLVDRLFGGMLESRVVCGTCGHLSVSHGCHVTRYWAMSHGRAVTHDWAMSL